MRKTIITAVISAALLTGGLGAALAPAASRSTRPVYYAPTWHAELRPGNIIFGTDGGIWARCGTGWKRTRFLSAPPSVSGLTPLQRGTAAPQRRSTRWISAAKGAR